MSNLPHVFSYELLSKLLQVVIVLEHSSLSNTAENGKHFTKIVDNEEAIESLAQEMIST